MLPEDRKIRDKSDLISALRGMTAENAAARVREASTVRDGPPPLAAAEGADRPMSATSRSLVELEAAVNAATRKLNGLRNEADRKATLADKLESDLRAARSENKALDAKETPEGKRIAELEEELGRVEAAFSERDYRQRQLEHMEARLEGNATAMDAHIKSMEDALGVSGKELADIQGFLRQLENGKDQALHELEAFHERMQSERQRRASELEAKRAEFEQAKKAEAWRRQRESVRAELAAELAGDLSKEQEEELKATRDEKERLHRELEIERREREERAAALHEAFQQIKGITGVATLDEMTERFLGHEAARESLQSERAETEQRLAAARAAVAKAERDLSELRATGQDGGAGAGADADATQEAFAAAELELADGRSRLRRLVTAADRVQGMVVAVRQGAAGVAQRLEPFGPLLDAADEAGRGPAADLTPLEAEAFGFADRGSLASPGSPDWRAGVPPSPMTAGGASAGGASAGGGTGASGSRVDVQKQGREAFRLLLSSLAKLRRLVGLVDSAVAARRGRKRGSAARRASVSRRGSVNRRRQSRVPGAAAIRTGGEGKSDGWPGTEGGKAEEAGEGSGSEDGGSVSGSSFSSYDWDDPRAEERRAAEEERERREAAEARERAKLEVMVNAPVFTLFGMRGRKGAEAAAPQGRRGRRGSTSMSMPLEDPVPHANNIRVRPLGAVPDTGSVGGSVMSSARSRGAGAYSVVGGSPREGGAAGADEDDEGGMADDGKSVLSAGGAQAAVRARRMRRRKGQELPSHRALKDAAKKRLDAKRAEQRESVRREKHRDKLQAEAARKATLSKLTKTTRAPTGMDFLTRMPKLL